MYSMPGPHDSESRRDAFLKANDARNLLIMGKPQDAIAACNEAIEMEPSFQGVYQTRANAYSRLGLELKAEADRRHLELYRRLFPTSIQLGGIVTEKGAGSSPDGAAPTAGDLQYWILLSRTRFQVSEDIHRSVKRHDEIVLVVEGGVWVENLVDAESKKVLGLIHHQEPSTLAEHFPKARQIFDLEIAAQRAVQNAPEPTMDAVIQTAEPEPRPSRAVEAAKLAETGAKNLQDLRRINFRQRVRIALLYNLAGAALVYLGLLSWFVVGWYLGLIVGVPGVIALWIGLNVGLTKSSLQLAIDVIDEALRTGEPKVRVQSIHETIKPLWATWESAEFKKEHVSILLWNPLYDRVLQLIAETVEGDMPSVRTWSDGIPRRNESRNYVVEGGSPFRRYPEGWQARAQEVVEDFKRERAEHQPSKRGRKTAELLGLLQIALDDPKQLSNKQVEHVRRTLASNALKRGLPDSPRSQKELTGAQEAVLGALNCGEELTRVIIARLNIFCDRKSFSRTDEVLAPITDIEAERSGLTAGQTFPKQLEDWVLRSLNAPLEELIDRGLISSGRVLKGVLVPLTRNIPIGYLFDLGPQDMRDLHTALTASTNKSVDGRVLCPDCGTYREAGRSVCLSCAISHARVRRIWQGALTMGVGGLGAIAVVLAVALGGGGSGQGTISLAGASTCDQEPPLEEGSTFTWVTAEKELCFDSDDDFIEITNTTGMDFGAGDFSISLRVNFSSLSTDQTLLHKAIGTAPEEQGYTLEWSASDRSLRFVVREGDANQNDLRAPAPMVAGQWHQVVAVRVGNTNAIYLDGGIIGAQTGGISVDTGTGGVARIGNNSIKNDLGERAFKGLIDQFELLSRVISEAELRAISYVMLADVAGNLAGGPGAIYVGDLAQLVGPGPTPAIGGLRGNVPLASLQRQSYIYESDYYHNLLKKAKFINPTPLVSEGESIQIIHACVNRTLLPCQLMSSFFAPSLLERTNGQINIHVSSFPEMGLDGADMLRIITDGLLSMTNFYDRYVARDLPAIEISNLWGIYPDREAAFLATAAVTSDLDRLVSDATGGGVPINHNWFSATDQYIFSQKPLRAPEDLHGLQTRMASRAATDWIDGMGANAQYVAFSEVYTALERGILNGVMASAYEAHRQKWYELTDYMNGPLVSFYNTANVINAKFWSQIPEDLQQIFIEEGAKAELEALRLASIQNEAWVEKSVSSGLELVEFSQDLRDRSDKAVRDKVIPGWIKRLGGPGHPIIDVFNEKIGPLVGFRINSDGLVENE